MGGSELNELRESGREREIHVGLCIQYRTRDDRKVGRHLLNMEPNKKTVSVSEWGKGGEWR